MNSSRPLITVCALSAAGLVVAALAFCARSGGDPVAPLDPSKLGSHDFDLESERVGDRSAGPDSIARVGLAPLGSTTDRSRLRLAVVDGASRNPLPGAEVLVLDGSNEWISPSRSWGKWMGPDLSAYLRAHGQRFVTDELGLVDLPPCALRQFVAARSGELFAFHQFDQDVRGVHEIELWPSHDVEVVVRDTSGRPCAGVGVALSSCLAFDAFWVDVTDELGQCRIRDIETVLDEASEGNGEIVALRLDFASLPAVETWIDPSRLPAAPIELVLPPTGSLRVRVVDSNGHLLLVDGELTLGTIDYSTSGKLEPFRARSVQRLQIHRGRGIVSHVGLSTGDPRENLWLVVDLPGPEDASVQIVGPKLPGETIDVDIPLELEATLVTGRAVDEAGRALAGMQIDWCCVTDAGASVDDSEDERFTTGSDGRFAWAMPRNADQDDALVRRTCHLLEVSRTVVRRQAVLLFPREIAAEVVELGDVVLAPGGPLVTGRIEDAQGRAVPDIEIEVVVLSSESPLRRGAATYDATSDEIDEVSFIDSVHSAEDGTFALYGPCLDLRFAVRVSGQLDDKDEVVPFTCGASAAPIRIVLPARGALCGTALVDHEWNGWDLDVRFVPDAGGSDAGIWADSWRVGDIVHFRFESLAPQHGIVAFHAAFDESSPVLIEIADVEIAAARESRPAALVDVDLRGRLTLRTIERDATDALELEVVDTRGRPVQNGLVWVSDARNNTHKSAWIEGRVRIEDRAPARVEVWAAGMRVNVLDLPITEKRIVLEPELELEVVFTRPRELTDASVEVMGTIWLDSKQTAQHTRVLGSRISFTPDGARPTSLRVAGTGIYDIQLEVARRIAEATEDDDGLRTWSCVERVEVLAIDGPQRFSVTFPADEAVRAADWLGLSRE